jgi:methionyl-tRNA formyltransferase
MRLAYLGTPEMAVPPLRALHDAGHEVVLVVTGADKRRGRRGAPTPSPVKAAATELGLAVSHDPDDLLGVDAELGVVVAYGRLLRPHLLAHLDMVNLHFSLLPRWRGAAPVERALLAGDPVTGVCVMKVDEGLDTGCVYEAAEVPIEAHTTAAELRSRLVEVGCELLVRSLADGLGACTPQDAEGVTYASKLDRNDLHLDWALPGSQLDRVVRLGGAWTTFRGETFKVHEATIEPAVEGLDGVPGTVVGDPRSVAVRTGDGLLRLQRVQPAGKAAMAAADWANGARPVGEVLGDPATGGS